jgi:hypothetical protein
MRRGAITRESVLKAIAEHDELGRETFLETYHYGKARSYILIYEGRDYDSKAIAGVAHKWDQGRALAPGEFSGGKDHAAAWLKRLGFQVKAVQNPDWARDKIILACDLVMANGWKGLDAQDGRVIELSALLQLLPVHTHADRNETFRNPNGVARKTFDIATRHPDYRGKPTKGGALDVTSSMSSWRVPTRWPRWHISSGRASALASFKISSRPTTRSLTMTSVRPKDDCSCVGIGHASGTEGCVRRRSSRFSEGAAPSHVRHVDSTSRRSTASAEPATPSATTSCLCTRLAKERPSSAT